MSRNNLFDQVEELSKYKIAELRSESEKLKEITTNQYR